jgi:diguanylate cyclase (GGDEF)-like protein/putative nucleotidyltransferase with HDIG domain
MAAVTLFACLATAAIVYVPTRRATRERVRRSLMAAVTTGAMLIDAERHARLRPGDEKTLLYSRIKRRLVQVKRANPGITEAYTMVKTSDPNTLRFSVDAADPEDTNHDGRLTPNEIPARIGEEYDISAFPQMREAFVHPTSDAEPTADKWGIYLSAYAPIRDRKNRAVAILGVDMTLADLMALERAAYWSVVRAIAISLLIAFVLGLLVGRPFVAAIERLVEGARQVRNGNLDFRVGIARGDELGRLAQAFDEMVASLSRDGLTGLYNRRYFHERLTQEVARARRTDTMLCVLVIDLDGFKAINDLLGHPAGDEVLQNAASALQSSVRIYDVLARTGGDEFAVILPETPPASAQAGAERFLKAICDQRIPAAAKQGEEAFVTASAGIACYPLDATGADSLMLAADLAMLRGKHTSPGGVSCYASLQVTPSTFGHVAVDSMIQRATWSAIETLAALVDARAPHVRAHSEVVARYAVAVARQMGLDPTLVEQAKIAGLLHDIGHITTPDSILSKPGPLTPQEWEIVRQHPLLGSVIISKIPHLRPLVEPIRCHHEQYDGSGYPEARRGESIPILARILNVVDAYEAMTSTRTYRRDRAPLSPQQALAEVRSLSDIRFDPHVVEALAHVVQAELAHAGPPAQVRPDAEKAAV